MLFRLQGVAKTYGETSALRVDSLDIEEGRVTGFVGPNGAGKTTLLQILACLLEPTSGAVFFRGVEILPQGDPAAARQHMTYLAQNPILFHMSVVCNVAYGLRLRGAPRGERLASAMGSLEAVGLPHLARRKPHQLSAGERQRVALARALCLRPDVLILDEPTANVDREHVEAVERIILSRREEGASVIVASHDHPQVVRVSDAIFSLESGRLGPSPFENLFAGRIEEREEGSFFIGPNGMQIEVITRKTGPAKVAIHPNEVILSRSPLQSSVRNCLRGVIRSSEDRKDLGVRVTVDVGVPFLADITRHSLQEMALTVGQTVFVSFKSTGVVVF